MGLKSKIAGFLKESWEGIMSPGPMNAPNAYHRAGFEKLHSTLTGTNMPAAYQKDKTPSLKL